MSDEQATILVVEDNEVLSMTLCEELNDAGYNALKAENGDEALAMIPQIHPKLILLDLMMPQKNGFEMLADLRKDEATKDIPVIVMSNVDQPAYIDKALEMGATEYLVKSTYKLESIVEKVEGLLEKGDTDTTPSS